MKPPLKVRNWDRRGVRLAAMALMALGLGWAAITAAVYTGYLSGFPYQVDAREGAQIRTTRALAEGRNPWSPRFAPADYNCYGVLYPLAASRMLPPAHRGVRAHRALSLAAVGLAALLLGAAAFRLSLSPLAGLAAGLAAAGGFLFFVTPTARCDAFAALFFIAPLALLALTPYPAVLIPAVALAALSFFTKPYAAVSGPFLCLVLAAQGRWRTALGFGVVWAALLALLAWGAERAWPGYLECTLLLHSNAAQQSFTHLVRQAADYLFYSAWPLLVLAAVAAWRFRGSRQDLAWGLPALAALALIMLFMGWHPGAALEYHFQLLHPTALLAVAALWRRRPAGERWLEAGLVLCACLSVNMGTIFLPRFANADLSSWRQAEALTEMSRTPLAPALLTSVLTDKGRQVADNGQTEYLGLAGRGAWGSELRDAAKAWQASWDRRLARGEIDVWFCDPNRPVDPQLLKKYAEVGFLRLECPVSLVGAECYKIYRLKTFRLGPPFS